MLRTITINVLTMMVLVLSSQTLLAQPSYHNNKLQSERLLERKPHYSPLIRLQRFIREAEIYEYLLGHPNMIKLQDMAKRVWDKQTGNKRRIVTWSRRNIIRPGELPVRTPYQ